MFPTEITTLLPRGRNGGIILQNRLEHVARRLDVQLVFGWVPEGIAGARVRTDDNNTLIINESMTLQARYQALATFLAGVALDGPGNHRVILTIDEAHGHGPAGSSRAYQAGMDLLLPLGPTTTLVRAHGAAEAGRRLGVEPETLAHRIRTSNRTAVA